MYLERISIVNYKNLEQIDLKFSPILNCFVGNNGEGKTNLLDAIHYLSMCKSHFQTSDIQNIKDDAAYFILKGNYIRKNEEELVQSGFKRGGGKSFKINNKEYDRLADHIGYIPLVIITPSDTSLINDGSDERRKYLNTLISQSDKEYMDALLRYNHVLANRNKLLKERLIQMDVIDVLNDQLHTYGQTIFERRKSMLAALLPVFQNVYAAVSGQKEQVSLLYRSDLEQVKLNELLIANWEKDKALQYTSVGVHKDDLLMTLDGRPIKKSGSQGQQKTFLIAMKMAQFKMIQQHAKLSPILLMDDIFDKLDALRVEQLISLVVGRDFGQIFLTDSNKNRLDLLLNKVASNYKLFDVKDGCINEIEASN